MKKEKVLEELLNSEAEKKTDVLSTYLSQTNKLKYNFFKFAEELQELSLLCLQFGNKIEDKRPHIDRFVEEAGDVLLRFDIFLKTISDYYGTSKEEVLKEINKRIDSKSDNIIKFIKENKYKGGI